MRILVINNYSMRTSMQWVEAQLLPRHHVWGIDALSRFNKIRYLSYKCPHLLNKLHLSRFYYYWFQFLSLIASINCRCIYAAASPLIDLLAFCKYKGWIKKDLFMIVHHPGNFSLKNKDYTRLIFITRIAYIQACFDYPHLKQKFIYDEWGPDIEFYDKITKDVCVHNTPLDHHIVSFVSNGKANRDHETLVKAARGLNAKVSVICTKKSSPSNYNPSIDTNITVLAQDAETIMSGKILSYPDMIKILEGYDVIIIPIPAHYKALCGLTSFNDAIALGKPVIIADTANLGIDVEKEGFGFVYKGGDYMDLREKMLRFIDCPDLIQKKGLKARQYAEKNDNRAFSQKILSLIDHENCNTDLSSQQ